MTEGERGSVYRAGRLSSVPSTGPEAPDADALLRAVAAATRPRSRASTIWSHPGSTGWSAGCCATPPRPRRWRRRCWSRCGARRPASTRPRFRDRRGSSPSRTAARSTGSGPSRPAPTGSCKVAATSAETPYDEVVDEAASAARAPAGAALPGRLTELQREAITLAYYGGHTYREVARPAGHPAADREDPDARRPDPAARLPGCGGGVMTTTRHPRARRRVRAGRGRRRRARRVQPPPAGVRGLRAPRSPSCGRPRPGWPTSTWSVAAAADARRTCWRRCGRTRQLPPAETARPEGTTPAACRAGAAVPAAAVAAGHPGRRRRRGHLGGAGAGVQRAARRGRHGVGARPSRDRAGRASWSGRCGRRRPGDHGGLAGRRTRSGGARRDRAAATSRRTSSGRVGATRSRSCRRARPPGRRTAADRRRHDRSRGSRSRWSRPVARRSRRAAAAGRIADDLTPSGDGIAPNHL